MYKKILVPLDGSATAEEALPAAAELSRAFGSRLVLLRALVFPSEVVLGLNVPDEQASPEETEREIAREYLERVAARLHDEGLEADTLILRGPAAEAIVDGSAREEVDLIVMSTHGRSGLKRWVWGSVAEKVLRHARVPLHLIRSATEPG